MAQELSQKELERMVDGDKPDPNCVFYEESKIDVEASKKADRRIYNTVLMVKYTQPGVTDWAPQRAQPADIKNNPEAYSYFLTTKGDVGSPSVTIIPGIHPNEAQELIDYGVGTITKLCAAKTLPAHLQHLQASARRLSEVLENERESNEKNHQETEDVSATGRPVDAVDVGRPVLPGSVSAEVIPAAGRVCEGGRLDGSEGQNRPEGTDIEARREEGQKVGTWSDPNWNISFG